MNKTTTILFALASIIFPSLIGGQYTGAHFLWNTKCGNLKGFCSQ